MLFAAKRYDISDQVIRQLNRAEKREQLTSKQLKKKKLKKLKKICKMKIQHWQKDKKS